MKIAVVDAQLADRQRELGRLEAEVDAQDLLLTDRKMELSTVTTELATARHLLAELSSVLVFFLKIFENTRVEHKFFFFFVRWLPLRGV